MLHDEHLLTLAEAADSLPLVGGKRPHATAVWRWARRGVRGIKLETLCMGGRFLTSREALERFGRALAAVPPSTPAAPPPTSPAVGRKHTAVREKQIAQAVAVLAAV